MGNLFAAGQKDDAAGTEIVSPKGGTVSEFYPEFGVIPVPSKVWRIGVMEKTLINDFWLDCKNGYEDAARDYGVEVDIYAAPSESDLLVQKQILDDMLAKDTKAGVKEVLGVCVSMGITVEGKSAKEVQAEITSGAHDDKFR